MTVKVPPRGTKGIPFPRAMTGFANRMVLRQFRKKGVRTQGGLPTFMLETVGAKSGQMRQAVLATSRRGQDPGS